MPKIYTDADKADIRVALLKAALHLLAKNGYKRTSIQNVVDEVGVSKSLFYKMFDTKEELVMYALFEQQQAILRLLRKEMTRTGSDHERIRNFIVLCAENKGNRLFIMNIDEEREIYNHLTKEHFRLYQARQMAFYREVLLLMGKDPEICSPVVFGDLMTMMLVIGHSTPESFPFLTDITLAETRMVQVNAICDYLESH